jgi:hypothetical protein
MILDIFNIGSKIIDKIWPDKDEADKAKIRLIELQQAGQFKEIDSFLEEQRELTKRHQADMLADSWLSKNIRPMALIALVVGYFVFATGSAFGINVTEAYVELLGQWGMLAFSFYFGSRGMEKIAEIVARAKEKKE